jgi:hypothetical protein
LREPLETIMTVSDSRLLLLSPLDNVFVAREPLAPGETIQVEGVVCQTDGAIGLGHKIARREIKAGEKIYKYGASIGTATAPIAQGAHAHVHNVKSDYTASQTLDAARIASGDNAS